MAHPLTPMVARRALAYTLRQLREQRELTIYQVADAMEWSYSKASRIENAQVTISGSDLRPLLAYYGVKDRQEIDRLVGYSRASRYRSWLSRDPLPPGVLELAEVEATAVDLLWWAPMTIPEPLQTDGYAEALRQAQAGRPPSDLRKAVPGPDSSARRRVEFERRDTGTATFVLDEAALRHAWGAPAPVVREQVDYLHHVDATPGVEIWINPFDGGLPPMYGMRAVAVHDVLPMAFAELAYGVEIRVDPEEIDRSRDRINASRAAATRLRDFRPAP
ncbi:Scr1 family TA system antitoxin-like transcriptional regulator [Dactylosporangium sp. NPDC049742]|uniref:Scr1 family TA system antitoxin-like transcriptional regulator n=1 Tax=Dactylosporangium sp. NPDC049742 TaxID=3154737 RepID=UPI003418EB6D